MGLLDITLRDVHSCKVACQCIEDRGGSRGGNYGGRLSIMSRGGVEERGNTMELRLSCTNPEFVAESFME